MEPNMPPVQMKQPTTQPFRQASNNKILIYIIIAVVSAAISGVVVWYLMNQQNTNDKKTLMSQITTKDNSISELQKTITNLEVIPIIDTTTTLMATDDISTLKAFCINDGLYNLSNFYYASVPGGIYGGCNIGNKSGVGGTYRITKKVNDKWTLVLDTQQSSTAFLKANSIPLNVVISPDAYNLLP